METNVILQGDNVTVLKSFPDECIDLTVTSPPYDEFDENWQIVNRMRHYKGHDWNFPYLARQLFRVIKDGGVVVWIVGDQTKDGTESLSSFKQAIYFKDNVGFRLHDTMIYQKNYYMAQEPNRYTQVFEYCFILSKGAPKTSNLIRDKANKNHGDTYLSKHKNAHNGENEYGKERTVKHYGPRTNIWIYNTGNYSSSKDAIAFDHPAVMPEALAKDHIKSWSNEGDTILDPFAGSGTTLKAASHLNRKWIGIEIAPEYIEIAKKRISTYSEQARLQTLLV